MALILNDRVRETTNTTGTGTFTLLGAVTGYQSFSVIGNGNTCFYACADQGGPNWEVGLGTYSSGTLARTTVLSSSNSGSLVNFTAGTKDVFVTQPSEKAVYLDGSGNITPSSVGPLTVSSLTDSGLTSGRVTYATTGGLLTDSANLTFNGTTLTTANDASISGLTVGKGGGSVSGNTVLGYQAGYSNTTGTQNVYSGTQAGYSNSTSNENNAFGYKALYTNTAGNNNAFGSNALGLNTTGNFNSAFGQVALYSNTTGANNTAFGAYALLSNTTASNNTAVGYQAGYSNQTGTQNTLVGTQAGYSSTGGYNTCFGYQSGYAISTGTGNTLIGIGAGSAITTGTGNTIIGNYYSYAAGGAITTGGNNTLIGGFSGNNGGLDIRTANNYIVLSDGAGNPRQVIDSSGNVGIGTGSPTQKLCVNGASIFGSPQTFYVGDDGGSLGAFLNQTASLPMRFNTAGIERMRIDSSGNVGIGTSSPVSASGYGALTVNGTTGSLVYLQNNATSAMQIATNSSGASITAIGASLPLYFSTNSTERMRIDSSGNLLVGTTTATAGGVTVRQHIAGNEYGLGISVPASGAQQNIRFVNGTTAVGSVTTTSSLTTYNTISDYRLKTVIGSIADAGQRIDALEPIEYDWKAGGRTRGFLAHQFAEVYPNSVSGEKDAVDKEDKPVYQSMQASTSEVMADLIAEIQSLRKRVAQLESK